MDETNKNQSDKEHKQSFNKEKHSKRKDSKKHKKEERLKDIDNAENGVQFKEKSKNQRKYANENSEELLDVKNGKTKVKRKRMEEDGSFGMYLNLNSSTIDNLDEWCLERRVRPQIKPSRMPTL